MERDASRRAREGRLGPSARARARAPRPGRAGLTLIEIMVVVVIVAIASTGVSMGIGALTRTSLRSACVRLSSLVRYSYHRSLTHGTTVRLTLNMESGTFNVTEAHGRVTLVRSDAPLREAGERAEKEDDGEDAPAEDSAALDPWEAARLRLEQPDALVMPASPFAPLTTPSGATMERFSNKPIGDDVRFTKVIVAHEAEPREEGTVDLFFFPGGLTQHAVVQLIDRNEIVYSVEVHPLSGRTVIHDSPYEPEVLMDDPTQRDESATELDDR
jgi:prepilin-type N-terminal cleavage/methylation domain-containing protein